MGDSTLAYSNERVEGYDWAVASELPYDFAAIRHPADVLGFVRKWGFLHADHDEDADKPTLEEFMTEALAMNYVLYRYSLIRPGRAGPAAQWALAEFWAGVYAGAILDDPRSWLTSPERGRRIPPEFVSKLADDADYEEMAIDVREALEEELWEADRLPRVEFSIRSLDFYETTPEETRPTGEFLLTAMPSDLLARAYLEVALEMTAGVTVAACPEDGRIFPVRDPRQVYCSTQCAGRARYRRYTNKKEARHSEGPANP